MTPPPTGDRDHAGRLVPMPDAIRLMIEARERDTLSPHAMGAAESEGRPRSEEPDPIRTAFQRDRDRVLHSKPFRRLKHKTQVFIDPAGDHYRTRLTHTLEVAAVARTIGRALRLNEDLIEAIALAHDVGHPPFGHAGERALDAALKEIDPALGFRHDAQSLRIVDKLLDLNLSQEVRAGIAGHSKGRKDLSASDGEPVSTLEAAVVRISDRVAYLNHDLDDALRSGMIENVPSQFADLGNGYSARLGTMVRDVIANSWDLPRIAMSPDIQGAMNGLKEWMFENVYLRYPIVYPELNKAEAMVHELLHAFVDRPEELPPGYTGIQGAVDYLSGMTDRFAVETFLQLRVPKSWR